MRDSLFVDANVLMYLAGSDALHVATMETQGVERLLSADRLFDQIDNVTRVDPLAIP